MSNNHKTMKKLILIAFSYLLITYSYGQNDGIDFRFVHSPDGKEWTRMESPDGPLLPDYINNAIFTFYSDGRFSASGNKSNSNARAITTPGETRKWAYDPKTNILSWELKSPAGELKKYQAEITFVDKDRMVTNLSENGEEAVIFVLENK
jgi:hypothetical protein